MEAILGHFFVNFGVRLIVVVDAILGVVVALWLSFWEDAGIYSWHHVEKTSIGVFVNARLGHVLIVLRLRRCCLWGRSECGRQFANGWSSLN